MKTKPVTGKKYRAALKTENPAKYSCLSLIRNKKAKFKLKYSFCQIKENCSETDRSILSIQDSGVTS